MTYEGEAPLRELESWGAAARPASPQHAPLAPVAQRLDDWRRLVVAAALLGVAAGLGFAAVVGAVAVAVLATAAPVLALLVFGVVALLVLRGQGGLMAVAAALWHLADALAPAGRGRRL